MGVTSQTGTQTHTVEMSASVVVNASTSFIQVEDESRTELFPSNVLADLDLNASSATLVRERKFIHSCGSVGRLEDVVVSDDYRGRQLGKLLVTTASLLA